MKTYYLKDKEGYIVSKFELLEESLFEGRAYECVGWLENKEPFKWLFHSEVYAKWDGCSHWHFWGEDYDAEKRETNTAGVDSYYHICSAFENFIRIMCFVWKLAGRYHKRDLIKRNLDLELTKEEYDLELIDYMLKDYVIEEETKECQ